MDLPDCPVASTLSLLKNYWTIFILRDLFIFKERRFNELKRSLGNISHKVLTDQLKYLENYGLIKRIVYPEVPVKVQYSLTDLGCTLAPIFIEMLKWGNYYKTEICKTEGYSEYDEVLKTLESYTQDKK